MDKHLTTADIPYRSIWTDLMSADFRQTYVQAGEIRTRYAQSGESDAPALIFVHGTGGSWETFSANLEAHSKLFNCFALDLVGCGLSDKPDKPFHVSAYVDHLVDFMQAVGVTRASFVGVSLGSWIAASLAHTHPQLVEKLVLLSPAGLLSDPSSMNAIREKRGGAAQDPTWERIKAVFDRLILDPANRLSDLVAARQRIYRLPEMKRAMENILVLQDPEHRSKSVLSEADWMGVEQHALIVASVDADDIYLKTAKALRNLLPNNVFFEMRNVAHWPHFEDAETFNKRSIEFLLDKLE